MAKEVDVGYGHIRDDELVWEDSGQELRAGLTADRLSMYVGCQTRKGDLGTFYLSKEDCARWGSKMMNWARNDMREE